MSKFQLFLFFIFISTRLVAADFEESIRLYEKDFYAIEERREGGELVEVKVSPEGWPSYYLIDAEGNGGFQRSSVDGYHSITLPNWILFRF